ncbi:M23 family metallopeptidase [Caenispirillum salinarum]|uniref:M23 family metallopeptidase n=1 Tax=Caenispirillum salinarum TaxID=859058 RepID=UPI00384B29CD
MRRLIAAAFAALLFVAPANAAELTGPVEQGALVFGRTLPGTSVTLDGQPVRVDEAGRFVIGFGRDAEPSVELVEIGPDGGRVVTPLTVGAREWDVQRIDGLPPKKVTPDPDVIARIRAESAAIAEVRAVDRASDDVFAGWVHPVQGETVVSGVFGSQRILNGEPRSPHSGTDYAAETGRPVLAAGPGVVSLVHDGMFFTGQTLMIDHGHGVQSVYAHLSRMDVAEGDVVAAGQKVGEVGATGRATGPHLHFGVSWFGNKLDPQTVLGVVGADRQDG